MVVVVGLTDGFAVVAVNPLGFEVQLYVLPDTELAPIEVELPLQIVLFEPALLVGFGLIVILFVEESLHPEELDSTTLTFPTAPVPQFTEIPAVPAPEAIVPPETVHT